jgi:hypothetical protein
VVLVNDLLANLHSTLTIQQAHSIPLNMPSTFPPTLLQSALQILIFIAILPLTTYCHSVHTIYQYPHPGPWLGSLAVRPNGSILFTDLTSPHLYEINPLATNATPTLMYSLPHAIGLIGIAETTPDVFFVVAGNFTATSEAATPGTLRLYRIDYSTVPSSSSPHITLLTSLPLINGLTPLSATMLLGSNSLTSAV